MSKQIETVELTNEEIKTIALANGFTLKDQPDGSVDLNSYVYAFAREIFSIGVKCNA